MAEPISGVNENDMLRYWVWLSLVFGAGSTRVLTCLRHCEDDPQVLYEALTEGSIPGLPPHTVRAVAKHTLAEAESIIYYCRQHAITLMPIDSRRYPDMLRSIYAPPILLTAQGNTDLLDEPLCVSFVGTRNPSDYTLRLEDQIVQELCQRRFVIVSGFAKGVDSAAHTAALRYGGGTIAVLGCGVNVNYPRENARLREEMLSSGRGLFLSEYLPGVQPLPANFPRRNRILSGLSDATAVMEAAERSGSLITAKCACEQGRFLLCVPPADLFDRRYAGVIPLLRDGAILLMSYQDILMVYYTQHPQHIPVLDDGVQDSERLVFRLDDEPSGQPAGAGRKKQEKAAAEQQTVLPGFPTAAPPVTEQADAPEPESEAGQRIVLFLREHGETYADDIAAALDMDLSELLSELTVLELDGFVQTLFGKRYRAAEAGMA